MKMMRCLCPPLVLCGFFCLSVASLGVAGELRAGAAKISITPETDEPLHDPVYARSLILEAGGRRLAFVSADLAVFTSTNVEKTCQEKYGLSQVFMRVGN